MSQVNFAIVENFMNELVLVLLCIRHIGAAGALVGASTIPKLPWQERNY
jgi:hypothetical protein